MSQESRHNEHSRVVLGSSHDNLWTASKGEPHSPPQLHEHLLSPQLYTRIWLNAGITWEVLIAILHLSCRLLSDLLRVQHDHS